jgi:hypothetical protein
MKYLLLGLFLFNISFACEDKPKYVKVSAAKKLCLRACRNTFDFNTRCAMMGYKGSTEGCLDGDSSLKILLNCVENFCEKFKFNKEDLK